MKRLVPLLLILSLVFCGCGDAAPEETAAPSVTQAPATEMPATVAPATEEPTEVPTEAPTEMPAEPPTEPSVPTNPLTGEILETPLESRAFAVSVNNIQGAMPLHGVSKADLFFEMFINDYCTRGLAVYSDLSRVDHVGSVRSLRYNFTDLCQIYDAVVVHAGASDQVLADLRTRGVNNVNAAADAAGYHYRDQERLDAGYALEHTLMVRGEWTVAYAESRGVRVTRDPEKDSGLRFRQDGTPEGQTANRVIIDLIHGPITKQTIMEYSETEGKYLFRQYGKAMYDDAENRNICFENVVVMLCNVYDDGVYHVAELVGSGDGFFACGGKLVPIRWIHENMEDPIRFTLTDGTPLELGVGNTYVAVAPLTSEISWE